MSITVQSIKHGSEFLTAQQTVDHLDNFFPGWQWTAMVDGGVLYIKNLDLHAMWAMQLRVDAVDKRRILEAGGEFLERFGMGYDYKAHKLRDAPRDFTGAIVSDKWTPDKRHWNKSDKRWKA